MLDGGESQGLVGTVLVVDDQKEVVDLAAAALGMHGGLVILRAGRAEEALAEARYPGRRVDVLVTDIVLPGMKGTDLAKEFHKLHPAAGILFTSGYAPETLEEAGWLDAGEEYLAKPFRLAEFAQRVLIMVAAAQQEKGHEPRSEEQECSG